ncbi:MAG: GGDEF domain-containing protein [Spirochaetaceae bacterium]|jgi:diguanylate cyclase (GGDEF)-like protein|nr:GGDEF domain-containing protein [Spirochaetaceae bacterium]
MIYRTMQNEKEKFYNQSIRDPLTNLYTRTYMKDSVARLFSINDRDSDATIGIVALDIDYFKSVNDTYGHNAGDLVLKSFAEILFQETRNGDIQVRVGGEEFAVFIPCKEISVIINTAERIREKVEMLKFGKPLNNLNITVSCGAIIRQQNESLSHALNRADVELYKAKNSGRNRVCSQ